MSGEGDTEVKMERSRRQALIPAAARHLCQPHRAPRWSCSRRFPTNWHFTRELKAIKIPGFLLLRDKLLNLSY